MEQIVGNLGNGVLLGPVLPNGWRGLDRPYP